jgi:non-heme chloroperoxidase
MAQTAAAEFKTNRLRRSYRPGMTLTDQERHDIDRANELGRPPVVFVHGLWLLSSSWDAWRTFFEENGYATVAPGWPDDPVTVEAGRADPEVFAHKMIGAVSDHYAEAIAALTRKPVLIGHSFGGLIVQRLAGTGVAAATVAIDAAPFRGVLAVPLSSIRAGAPILKSPLNRGRAIALTFDEFKYSWANNLNDAEARSLYDTYHVAASGVPLFQDVLANLNPFTEGKVDTRNPARGPLLIIAGERDNTIPLAISESSYKHQLDNPGVTELVRIPGRGHSLTIDSGWRDVAQAALGFLQRTAV